MTTALSLLKLLIASDQVETVTTQTQPPVDGKPLPCKVCGESFTILGRHIHTAHQMDEQTYRRTFGLPAEEPLVSESYLAKKRRCIEAYGGRMRPSFGA